MFSSRVAKLVEIPLPKKIDASSDATADNRKDVIILGVSLSQRYSHNEYMAQTLDGIKEKIKDKMLQSSRAHDAHVVFLLSTAFDPANNPNFDIQNPSSPASITVINEEIEKTNRWISTHTEMFEQYKECFTYTVIPSNTFLDNAEYRRILEIFISAYKNGQREAGNKSIGFQREQPLKSLIQIDSEIDLTDKQFFHKMKFVIEAYVERHITKGMTKQQRDDIKGRSEWIVLREYALIFMLFLKKIPPAFSETLRLTEGDEISFAYPYGNNGKEVINLVTALYGHRATDLYNVKIPDFCNPRPKQQIASASTPIPIPPASAQKVTPPTEPLSESPPEDKCLLPFLVKSSEAHLLEGLEALQSVAAKQALLTAHMQALDKLRAQLAGSLEYKSQSGSGSGSGSGSETSTSSGLTSLASEDSDGSRSTSPHTTMFHTAIVQDTKPSMSPK